MANTWADTLPQWVRLSELPDLVPSKLGVAWDDAKQRLRDSLEAFRIYTDVPDWPHGSGGDSSLVDASAWEGRTAVSSKGWKSPELDLSSGTLKGYPTLVFWPHVVDELSLVRQRSTKPHRAAGPDQSEVNEWILNYFTEASVQNRPKPKVRADAFVGCQRAIGATDRQMQEAMRKIPQAMKRPRGRPSDKSSK